MAWVKWRWIQLIGCMILLVQGEENYIYNATVNVQVGDNVMLTCSTSATNQNDLRIYWQREQSHGGSSLDVVLAFSHGKISKEYQNDRYRDRVEVSHDELIRGNYSLLLKSVQYEDGGQYETIIVADKNNRPRCRTQLNVGAPFSRPQLTMEGCKESAWPSQVRCETWGGFPEPIINWIVGSQTINSDQVKTNSSITNGSFSVTSVLHLRSQEEMPVTCIVENPTLLTNESNTQTIHNCGGSVNLHGLLVLLPILLILAISVYLFCFFQKKSACKSNQEHPQESNTGGQGSQDNANVTIHLLDIK